MLDPQITTVLFDLDGTLLPMELEKFTNTYFGLLAKKAAPFGFQPEPLVAAVWKGTKAMVKNDGTETNDKPLLGHLRRGDGGGSPPAAAGVRRVLCQRVPRRQGRLRGEPPGPQGHRRLKGPRAMIVVLATNPIFPLVGVETRLSWVGLRPEISPTITAYENSTTCKPNPAYYAEILRNTGKRPQECLMVGNDATEDTAALEQGMGLPGDRLPLNPKGRDISGLPPGDLRGVFGVCRGVKVFPPFVTRTQKNPGIWGIIKAQKGEYP